MQPSEPQGGFDPGRLRTFYVLFDDATAAACLNGRPWPTVGVELIDCGPLNSFFFHYEDGGPVQSYLDQACEFAAFTPEFISEALGYASGYVAGICSISPWETQGLEERLGVLWPDDDESFRLTAGPTPEALTLAQFRALNWHLLGLIARIRAGRFLFSRVEWPHEEVYRNTRMLAEIPIAGVFELRFV